MPAIDPSALQRAMDKSGVTTKQLAESVGVSLSYMARIVKGERRLKRDPNRRRDIAKALDVPVHWIEVERPDPEMAVTR